MRVSSRHALPLLCLLVVASVPVWTHMVGRSAVDGCADPQSLLDVSAIGSRSRLVRQLDTDRVILQKTHGYVLAPHPEIRQLVFWVTRSFDPKRLYLTPARGLPDSNRESMFPSELRWIEAEGERIPLHLKRVPSLGDVRIFAFLFIDDDRPAAHPFRQQLASALPRLVSGNRPMTLVSATNLAPDHRADQAEEEVIGWMRSAWSWYRARCAP